MSWTFKLALLAAASSVSLGGATHNKDQSAFFKYGVLCHGSRGGCAWFTIRRESDRLKLGLHYSAQHTKLDQLEGHTVHSGDSENETFLKIITPTIWEELVATKRASNYEPRLDLSEEAMASSATNPVIDSSPFATDRPLMDVSTATDFPTKESFVAEQPMGVDVNGNHKTPRRASLQSYEKNYSRDKIPVTFEPEGVVAASIEPEQPMQLTAMWEYDRTCKPICKRVGELFPHLTNCDKYYQCSNRGPQSLSCGQGTSYSPLINTCDHAHSAVNDYCHMHEQCP
ncbi:uncharacterized protein LOC108668736 isoform X2 [Hyalella azteca]|uniref:Uncharacterized protein LOC108668736 isoform X2 n=1 Tax=Hyalella azteca TaxID=294128 RepID=A0A8B7ND74_HYAAZ|nr:uncharacterized protein LOC108668736 isoform X2 [Hyalella azteca]